MYDAAAQSGRALAERVVWPKRFFRTAPRILCLGRDLFNEDIIQLKERVPEYTWLSIGADVLTDFQQQWIAREVQVQGCPNKSTATNALYEVGWNLSEVQAAVMLGVIRPAVVMAANWDYWCDEGIRRACRAMGIPFLVLLREHIATRAAAQELVGYYRDRLPPGVTAVAVAGKSTRDIYIDLGIFDPEQLVVTGLPRFDRWMSPQPEVPRNTVILFAYAEDGPGGYGAGGHFWEVLREFARASYNAMHTDVRFIVKVKSCDDGDLVIAELDRIKWHSVDVVAAGSVCDLLTRARAVVGFNSLSVLESLLAPIPVIVPAWGEAGVCAPEDQVPSPGDADMRAEVDFISKVGDFRDAMSVVVAGIPMRGFNMQRRMKIFQSTIEFTPGVTASERVREWVKRFI